MRKANFVNALLVDVMAGAVALFIGLLGAFVYAGGSDSSIILFLFSSGLLLAVGVAVFMLRLRWHGTGFVRHLYQQLPEETACTLRGRNLHSADATELVRFLGNHVREQQELLNAHFLQNVLELGVRPASVSESEDTLRLLHAELQALEEQFKTDAGDESELP